MLFVTAAALVDIDGRVLLAERPAGKPMAGLWEFPGGKVSAGETPETALARELREELGIRVCPACFTPAAFVTHPLSHASGQPENDITEGCDPEADWEPDDPDGRLLMLLYLCRRWVGTPEPLEGQRLTWVRPREMGALPMPPADRPLVAQLMETV